MGEHPRYLAYMLRLWGIEGENGPSWRVFLESPHTGERQMFTSLEELLAFLCAETAISAPAEPHATWSRPEPPGGTKPPTL